MVASDVQRAVQAIITRTLTPGTKLKQLDSSLIPKSALNPAIRFTLAPDGKTFAYSIVKQSSSLWMLQGFGGK